MLTGITTIEIVDEYLEHLELERGLSKNSIYAYKNDLIEFFNKHKLKIDFSINSRKANEYISWLNSQGKKPSSIARKISSLKNFFKYLLENGRIKENPFEFIRTPRLSRYRPDYLTVAEVEKILSQPDRNTPNGIRNCAILELLYGAGLRISELINLKMSAVYDEIGFIKVIGKGNKERLVPYGKYARVAVERYLVEVREFKRREVESDILLLSSRNQKFSRTGIWKMVKKYVLSAGIAKSVTPHTFRHSFATHMIDGGADLRTVQELLGHSSITTTQIYTQVDRDYLLSMHREFHPRERKEGVTASENR